ncbi:hypothetical protein chiPu_0012412 [Chiloscyllium punctatum]|uniref:Secreted phosphoprotein 24 n=1 Tax=Chiloscyllium punctatum TaxID=137246 RepID=A0A401SU71_CHIPU|nr:hypothetical protein [Chiloscyllium punctatum]
MRSQSPARFLSPRCPPTDLPFILLEELREFVEETLSRWDRAQLALDRWSSFERINWSAHAARQAPGLTMNESESGTSWGHSCYRTLRSVALDPNVNVGGKLSYNVDLTFSVKETVCSKNSGLEFDDPSCHFRPRKAAERGLCKSHVAYFADEVVDIDVECRGLKTVDSNSDSSESSENSIEVKTQEKPLSIEESPKIHRTGKLSYNVDLTFSVKETVCSKNSGLEFDDPSCNFRPRKAAEKGFCKSRIEYYADEIINIDVECQGLKTFDRKSGSFESSENSVEVDSKSTEISFEVSSNEHHDDSRARH